MREAHRLVPGARFAVTVQRHDAGRTRTWRVRGHRFHEAVRLNSLIKAPMLVAVARHARDRALTARERALLTAMIRRSDDDAMSHFIRTPWGLPALQEVGRRARVASFVPQAGYWGASTIHLADANRLFLRLPSLIPRRHRSVYGLLSRIVRAQRWGLIRVVDAPSKAGWNGHGRFVQSIVWTCGADRLGISVQIDTGDHFRSHKAVERIGRVLTRPWRATGCA